MSEYAPHIFAWMPSGFDWVVILVVALLLFGRRLPEVARAAGKSLSEFKKGINEAKESTDEFVDEAKKVRDDVAKQAKDAAGLNDSHTV
jgi:sec-independent protein translocase protein TatA